MEESLLVNTTFGCPGTVRAWRYVLLTPTADIHFYLQVWRLDGLFASLVGSTRIDVPAIDTEGSEEVVTFLEAGEQFSVEAGDFLGVFVPEGLPHLPIPSRRFNLVQMRASEGYNFQIASGIQPTLLNLLDHYAYDGNLAINFQSITGLLISY